MTTAMRPTSFEGLEKLILRGDLSSLSPAERVNYYNGFCQRLGLDPFTQPFKIMKLNGREVLYCGREGTQQLSKLHSVSHEIKAREEIHDCYIVTAQASTPDGRHTESIGAVSIANLKGDGLCNAFMKAETKAKRRATLDLLGLGVLDQSEIETIPDIQTIDSSKWLEEAAPEPPPDALISREQRQQLTDIAKERGIPTEEAITILGRFGFKKTAEITADKLGDVSKAFLEWSPHSEAQIDCGALWISLQQSGDKRFSSKMKQLAHLLDWMTGKKYDVSNVTSLNEVPEEQKAEYASLLADLLAERK